MPAVATAEKETEFTPVEYWNAVFPNEDIVVRPKGRIPEDYDPAGDRRIKFLAGYYRATEPWMVEVIERECKGRAHRADSPEPWVCETCGWQSKSQKAFSHHQKQHA